MTDPAEAPYDEIVAIVAERLGMTREQVDMVMETYMEESGKRAQGRRRKREEAAQAG